MLAAFVQQFPLVEAGTVDNLVPFLLLVGQGDTIKDLVIQLVEIEADFVAQAFQHRDNIPPGWDGEKN
jgi:hypothetical protein